MINDVKIVALCASRIHDLQNYDFINSLNEYLCNHNCRLFVYAICTELRMYDEATYWYNDIKRNDAAVFDLIDFDVVDAVIIMDEKLKCRPVSQRIIDKADEKNIPSVIIEGEYENCINVNFDHESGMKTVIEHILSDHGITDVHYMSGARGNPFAETRLEIFKELLHNHNIPYDDSMVSYGDFWVDPTVAAMEKLLKRDKLPRAIICANDVMAITVCTMLQKSGYRVPEDVIVTGYDGIDEVYLSNPKITTSSCSYKKMAETVFELLMHYFSTGEKIENSIVSPDFFNFDSCGCRYNSEIDMNTYFSNINNRFYRYQDEMCIMMNASNKMQIVSFEEASKIWKNAVRIDMCCLINNSCIDDTVDPAQGDSSNFDDKMFVFCDYDQSTEFQIISRKCIVPKLDEKLKLKIPLIFFALDYINTPMGYVCFCLSNSRVTEYQKTTWSVMALNNAIGGIRDIRYQRHLNQQVEDMYKYDSLTGLYNRHGFFKVISRMAEEKCNSDCTVNLILLDLDGLKYINDTFGHKEGDNAIKISAHALKQACPGDAVCSRFGGDELVAWFFGEYDADSIKQNIYKLLEAYNLESDKKYTVAASFGMVSSEDYNGIDDFNKLFSEADKVMYEEKTRRQREGIYKHFRIRRK